MNTPQIIIITIGCLAFLAAFVFYYKANNIAGTATIAAALLLSLVGGVGPSTIKDIMFKQSKGGFELSIKRNVDTPEKIQSAIEIDAEIDKGVTSAKSKKLIQETTDTPDAMRSAADYLILATDNWQAGNYIEGIAFVQQGLRLDPKNDRLKATLLYRMGILLASMGDMFRAEEFYNKSIGVDSNFAWPHNGLGGVFRILKRYDEAEAAYRKALEIDPKLVNAHNNLGNLLIVLKRYNESEAAYRKALEIDPKDVGALNGLGNVLIVLKRYNEAEATYRKALEIDPGNPIVQHNLKGLFDKRRR